MTVSGRTGRPSVLVVDDDLEVIHVLRLVFEFDDFEVAEATSGPEAVARAIRGEPNFIVLDHLMPGIFEDTLVPVLRTVAPSSRIVAFSSEMRAKPWWADAYLNKERVSDVSLLLSTLLPRGRGNGTAIIDDTILEGSSKVEKQVAAT